jgi:hypothetical protein
MAAKDIYHDQVRKALERDGWTITHDPLTLPWGRTSVQIDLGAERLIAAEKGARKIAVEIKSFLSRSRVDDLEDALGQLWLYRYLLNRHQPERELFLAVSQNVYDDFISQPHVAEFLEAESVRLLVFDPQTEEVVEWIDWNNIEPSSSKP